MIPTADERCMRFLSYPASLIRASEVQRQKLVSKEQQSYTLVENCFLMCNARHQYLGSERLHLRRARELLVCQRERDALHEQRERNDRNTVGRWHAEPLKQVVQARDGPFRQSREEFDGIEADASSEQPPLVHDLGSAPRGVSNRTGRVGNTWWYNPPETIFSGFKIPLLRENIGDTCDCT